MAGTGNSDLCCRRRDWLRVVQRGPDSWIDFMDFGAAIFVLCLGGLRVSVAWLVVAAVVSAILSDRAQEGVRRDAG